MYITDIDMSSDKDNMLEEALGFIAGEYAERRAELEAAELELVRDLGDALDRRRLAKIATTIATNS
jgi:hypothetical protein